MGKLDGQVAVITGAGQGIGASAAALFHAEGARLMLADRDEALVSGVCAELGSGAASEVVDVASDGDMRRLVDATLARYGRLDIAVLNAGLSGPIAPIAGYANEDFDRVMQVNVWGVWLGLKYAMSAMQSNGGSIVITGSTSSIRAVPNRIGYVASKHAVVGLMRAAAVEGAPSGIRVNCVNPAQTDTPMVRSLHGAPNPGYSSIPMGRCGRPEEVARMMLFLASSEASFCTGGVYMVDGGVSAGKAG